MTERFELALSYAATVSRRIYDRAAPVRWGFSRSFEGGHTSPPMARMLRGGRGGSVRLKVYLSFLWFAAAPPHDVTYPARAWAGLIGLNDPEVNGARRVVDAITWLADEEFVTVQRRPGQPSIVLLRSELGDGSAYEPPGATTERLLEAGQVGPEVYRHHYVKLQPEFWTNGWIAELSGAALSMYLSLLVELTDQPAETTALWLSPKEARARSGLSEETRGKGYRELVRLGLVEVKRRPIGKDAFDFRRLRNVYFLRPERLAVRADVARAQADAWEELTNPSAG